jgi:hypothetical protein
MVGEQALALEPQSSSRLLVIPETEGRLLVCTDLHGNLGDFRRIREIFRRAHEARPGPIHLLFTGDLIHGPNYPASRWPDYLGAFYEDASGRLMDEFLELRQAYPGRVHCLLGNHEHSHVGGPHTPKFWLDETQYFEDSVGPERAGRYREVFRGFQLAAVTACGVSVTHAAPNVELESVAELEEIRYEGYERMSLESIQSTPTLGRLIWSRSCPPDVARGFLSVLGQQSWPQRVVVFGHEIVQDGFESFGDEQLLLSTSFGLEQRKKRYLCVDLSARYRSVRDLRPGREILPLYDL